MHCDRQSRTLPVEHGYLGDFIFLRDTYGAKRGKNYLVFEIWERNGGGDEFASDNDHHIHLAA
jgi:hypothetical protein